MSLGLVGRKVGMTRIFTDDGAAIPVTVLDVANNRVTQIKTPETDGYAAVQVTYGKRRARRVDKAQAGHLAKAGVEAGELLKEFTVAAEDLATLKVDLMSFSAHKTYGPKGVGALFVRRKPRVRIEAQMHGGGHERGMRSGTLATHQIVGMGEAFRLARLEMATDNERVRMLRDKLRLGISEIEEVHLNGDLERRVPHNLNVSFNYIEGESLIMAIKDVAVSSGSACTSASLEPSYVLRALGRSDELAHSSIRFTVGRFTTEEEIDFAVDLIKRKIAKLRDLSPLWEMYKDGVDLESIQWAAH